MWQYLWKSLRFTNRVNLLPFLPDSDREIATRRMESPTSLGCWTCTPLRLGPRALPRIATRRMESPTSLGCWTCTPLRLGPRAFWRWGGSGASSAPRISYNCYPRRPPRVQPAHRTVCDWLTAMPYCAIIRFNVSERELFSFSFRNSEIQIFFSFTLNFLRKQTKIIYIIGL